MKNRIGYLLMLVALSACQAEMSSVDGSQPNSQITPTSQTTPAASYRLAEVKCKEGTFSPTLANGYAEVNTILSQMQIDFSYGEIEILNPSLRGSEAIAIKSEPGACVATNGAALSDIEFHFRAL